MAHPWSLFFPLASMQIALMIICTPISAVPTYLDSLCSNEMMFLPNSSYKMNLKSLFLILTTRAATSTNNFYSAVVGGKEHDTVYGLFLCRGDLSLTSCKDCVVAATMDLHQSYCPWRKVAVIWYSECMVRYSNESLSGKLEESPKLIISNSQNITRNQIHFKVLQNMMIKLAVQVASDKSGKNFAIKSVNFTDSQALFMLLQCTPDLTVRDCSSCLKIAITLLPVRISGRTFLPSCNVWYVTTSSNFQLLTSETTDSSMPTNPTRDEQFATKVIVVTVLPIASILIALLALCLTMPKAKKSNVAEENGEDLVSIESLRYKWTTLQIATNNFSDDNKVAEGFFGSIYSGKLSGGRKVAVKRLSKRFGQNVQEFKEEVRSHAKLQHRNLVEFIGFCLEGEERLLICEHIPNPNLHYFLIDPERRTQLDWGKRYHIICGIARGMLYLDKDSRLRIIHSDLRPANILLDANMNAKVSHFGLAVTSETDRKTDKLLGSFGYMSPEETIFREFSIKSNVFCFGVLLLAIISGKRYSKLTNFYQINYAEDLLSQAWKKWREGAPLDFVDSTLKDPCSNKEVLRCMHLGLLCVQGSPDDRPSMASVVFMLQQRSKISLQLPEEPAFFFSSEATPKTRICRQGGNTKPRTINTVSISELQPR